MTGGEILAVLALPPESRVERRVPKSLLLENGAPTPADKRRINEGIEAVYWVAALKPATCGIAAYRDDEREIAEIAVLTAAFRPGAHVARLVELLHRAIPYPLLLIAEPVGHNPMFSLAGKRFAENEPGRLVLDGPVLACIPDNGVLARQWIDGLALAAQPQTNLWECYQGYVGWLDVYRASRLTKVLGARGDAARQTQRRSALDECGLLRRDISKLTNAAKKERQVRRLVDINLEITTLEKQYMALVANLER